MTVLSAFRSLHLSRFRPFVFASAGTAIAFTAWYPGRWLAVLFLLLLVWSAARTRATAFALMAGYYAAGSRDIPAMTIRFFTGYGELSAPSALALGAACWVAAAAALALPWAIFRIRSDEHPLKAHAKLLGAMTLTSLPPIGFVGWLAPAYALSTLPGTLLVKMILGAAACGMAWIYRVATSRARCTHVSPRSADLRNAIGILAAIAGAATLAGTDAPAAPPSRWVVVNTDYGKADSGDYQSRYRRNEHLQTTARAALNAGARVVIFPEEIAGPWTAANDYWWTQTSTEAAARGRSVVVGADYATDDDAGYSDALFVLGAAPRRFDSRAPMPVGLWRPWSTHTARLGSVMQPYAELDGRRVAFSICYEDFLLWPHWRALLLDRPDVIVDTSNIWFASDLAIAHIQTQSIDALSRIVQVPVLHASNHAATAKQQGELNDD